MTALPESEATFIGFAGACNGAVSNCAVAMNGDQMVNASFVAFTCEANTTTCSQQILNECDASGMSHPQVCLLGCHPSGTRCYDLAPSNVGVTGCLDGAAVEADAAIPDGATINTDTGAITLQGGGTITVPSEPIDAPADGVAVRCFRANNITIGDVTVTGASALAVAAHGTVTLTGGISVSARAYDTPGPGHLSAASNCNGLNGTVTGFLKGGGGGGGGFASAGGRGGTATVGATGGLGGPVNGTVELVPLRGGCSGGLAGTGAKKNAGGAIQILSRAGIVIEAGGGIEANGWGGWNGTDMNTAGHGGGSGGGILLEAPSVTSPAMAFLVANGGGGAGGTPGAPGAISTERAVGGPAGPGIGTTPTGAGGLGGALLNATLGGGHGNSTDTGFGGGGGGSAGRIRINTYNAFVPAAESVISPAPSQAQPGRR